MSEEEKVALDTPRVLIAGTSSGCGTSTIALGLMVALRKSGLSVSSGHVGNSLVAPTHFRRITSSLSLALNPWMLISRWIARDIARLASGAELVVIHAGGGLYDTIATPEKKLTVAELAREFRLPVVLVIDASGYEESLGALIRGFLHYTVDNPIQGIILNRVKDHAHLERLRPVVAAFEGVQFLGAVQDFDSETQKQLSSDKSRANPSLITRSTMLALGEAVGQAIDLEKVKQLASRAPGMQIKQGWLQSCERRVRIAVADDAAFHLMSQGNLDSLRRAGAELVACSPLADQLLPRDIGGLYLPGGYVDLYASELAANSSFLRAVREFAEQGGVLYAEGDAVSYLCSEVELADSRKFCLVGLIDGSARFLADAPERQNCHVVATQPNVLIATDEELRGQRERRWFVKLGKQLETAFQLRDPAGLAEGAVLDGLMPTPHSVASITYLHWGARPGIAENFIDACVGAREAFKARRRQGASGG